MTDEEKLSAKERKKQELEELKYELRTTKPGRVYTSPQTVFSVNYNKSDKHHLYHRNLQISLL